MAVLEPALPFDVSRRLAATSFARAGIDISDGLGTDLHQMARASQVGLRIRGESIPLAPIAEQVGRHFGVEPLRFAFATGGDCQFVSTGPPVDGSYSIGVVTPMGDGVVLSVDGRDVRLPNLGHDDTVTAEFATEIRQLLEQQPF